MGLFGKKDKEETPSLPDLPETDDIVLPSSKNLPTEPPKIPEIEVDKLPELPKMEKSNPPEKQIKDKIYSPEVSEPDFSPSNQNNQMQKSNFESPETPPRISPPVKKTPRAVEMAPSMLNQDFEKPFTKKAEPIYVRLDKFEETITAFEDIKTKIKEIEEILQKTRDIKQKEEEELMEWEREVQVIKARIDSIDKGVFNKLD
jgi:hypothetical protein